MKQSINPGVFFAIVAAVVVVAAIVCASVFRAPAPAVSGPATEGRPSPGTAASAAMKEAHGGPTESQRAQIQEWKKSHPGAYTRF